MNTTLSRQTSLAKYTRPLLLTAAFLVILVLFAALIRGALGSTIPGADFYTFWVSGKALFVEKANPYSQEVMQQAQMGILGRLAEPHEDQLGFAYPLFALYIIFPLAYLSFDWAISFWLAFNILAFITAMFFALPQRARPLALTALLMYPFFFGLVLGAFVIIIGCGILLFYGLLAGQGRRDTSIQVITGLLLAWSTVKPQFIWLVIGFALIYAVRERLYPFLISFFGSLALLFATSLWIDPSWPLTWYARSQEYILYVQSMPTITAFFQLVAPPDLAMIMTGIALVLCLGLSLFLLIQWWKGNLHWLKMLAWLGMLTYLFHFHGTAYEQVIFLYPVILWMGEKGSWKKKEVLGFWLAMLLFSWIAFSAGIGSLVVDRSPVLLNAIWVAWLFTRPKLQL